ncbi:hypothetical protein [Brenneria uluponensis]|uniref:hypothetical protein n=1 Tax=Brenneria uluponensis TaxID=3057057 RepID=UPI0028E89B85|nr:hypothetical protein [Brenneria ulupoensis]
MLVVVIGIGYEAWRRFYAPQTIQGTMVSIVAAIGLLVNLMVQCRFRTFKPDMIADKHHKLLTDVVR